MVAFYNALGGLMQVTESRVEEYKALGYQECVPTPLVPAEEPHIEPTPIVPAEESQTEPEKKVEPIVKTRTRTSATKKK